MTISILCLYLSPSQRIVEKHQIIERTNKPEQLSRKRRSSAIIIYYSFHVRRRLLPLAVSTFRSSLFIILRKNILYYIIAPVLQTTLGSLRPWTILTADCILCGIPLLKVSGYNKIYLSGYFSQHTLSVSISLPVSTWILKQSMVAAAHSAISGAMLRERAAENAGERDARIDRHFEPG